MKKLNIKVVFNNRGELALETCIAENFDEFTYYVSPKFKGNDPNLHYKLIDKKTGLPVVYSNSKQKMLDEYVKTQQRYEKYRKDKYYQKLIEKYQELLKEEEQKEYEN